MRACGFRWRDGRRTFACRDVGARRGGLRLLVVDTFSWKRKGGGGWGSGKICRGETVIEKCLSEDVKRKIRYDGSGSRRDRKGVEGDFAICCNRTASFVSRKT